jgi:hypothetical protein
MMSFEMNTIYFAYTNDDAAIVYCDIVMHGWHVHVHLSFALCVCEGGLFLEFQVCAIERCAIRTVLVSLISV